MSTEEKKEVKEKKEEINTVREHEVEVELGELVINGHPTYRVLSKFCDLYIGIDENFWIMKLQDAMIEQQEKFIKMNKKLYKEIMGEDLPPMGHKLPEPDMASMTEEEREALKKKRIAYGDAFKDLSTKKVTLKYIRIDISKDKLGMAMAREERKENGILISPNDLVFLRKFINFI